MMSNLVSIILYIAIVFAVLQNTFWLVVPLAVWFTFRCGAVWLLPAAFLIDGYFGAFYSVPVLSIIACVWFFFTEIVRPQLLWQMSYEQA